MAEEIFADWVRRGRTHQAEGRPADALPCFRRAAREDPRSPIPGYHLGESLWQLGLAGDALRAWRSSAGLDPAFLPSRLALAEAAIAQRDFATARAFAGEAAALAPSDPRAALTLEVATAATGDRAALGAVAQHIASDASLAHAPMLAAALAAALDADSGSQERASLMQAIAPHAGTLPLSLVVALAESGMPIPRSIAARRFTQDDLPDLRRLAVALYAHDVATSTRVAEAYCALAAALPPPAVPLLWPRRTAGATPRVAWLCPTPQTAAWSVWAAMLANLPDTAASRLESIVLCPGEGSATKAALESTPLAGAPMLELPARADNASAKILASRDCDAVIDGAGLTAFTAGMLAAHPARAVWAYTAGMPPHGGALVLQVLRSIDELAAALDQLRIGIAGAESCPYSAAEISTLWDAAVGAHQKGDLAAAAAGYAKVLEVQPGFAPALHLAGEIARAEGDLAKAREKFSAAIAAAPEFLEARLAAAELALAMRDPENAAMLARDGLLRAPGMAALWCMQARAELAVHDATAAEATLRRALGIAPADADLHFTYGVALQTLGDRAGAARAYQRALTFAPDMVAAHFNLGVIFQQQGNHAGAQAAYRAVLAADPAHASAYKNLGEVLLAAGNLEAWIANFRVFEAHCPKALPLAVYALEACQYQADFAALDRYLDGIRRDDFKARDDVELADCLEELLYLLLFFDIEPSVLLRHSQAYDTVSTRLHGAPAKRTAPRRPGRLRVGYLSADLRNHVMGKMMWQAIAHHDRERFDLYFYSTSAQRDDWTDRFAAAGKRFEVIAALDDAAAAARIAADDLDILVDLSTHTLGARPGVLAHKPARVQITHVASAGAVGLSAIDYKLTDQYCDVPESQANQIERMLVMEGCVYPFRHVAPAATHPFERAALGIPPDAIVIAAFVNPLKLSRRCLRLWRDVLERIPRAKLAFSPAKPSLRESYLRLVRAAGIAEDRVLFLPQGRDDGENQARYRVIDFVLDTLPFGGVNGTLEALDMGVPVVTLVGNRHGERTSYSILRNLGVDATIAQTGRDYVDIAARLADDANFRAEVRAAIAKGLAGSPLVDMVQHARNLEDAYLRALAGRAADVAERV